MKIARFWSVLRTEIFVFIDFSYLMLLSVCDIVMITNSTQYYI